MKKDCLCLNCRKRFRCDFVLSMWAAKSRMKNRNIKVSTITIKCDEWEE